MLQVPSTKVAGTATEMTPSELTAVEVTYFDIPLVGALAHARVPSTLPV